MTYWYEFFTCCEGLVPILHSVKFTGCEICGSICAGPESFVRDGPTLKTFFFSSFFFLFLVDEGREDPSTTISGPSTARQRNAILLAFRWWADDSPTWNAGLVTL